MNIIVIPLASQSIAPSGQQISRVVPADIRKFPSWFTAPPRFPFRRSRGIIGSSTISVPSDLPARAHRGPASRLGRFKNFWGEINPSPSAAICAMNGSPFPNFANGLSLSGPAPRSLGG